MARTRALILAMMILGLVTLFISSYSPSGLSLQGAALDYGPDISSYIQQGLGCPPAIPQRPPVHMPAPAPEITTDTSTFRNVLKSMDPYSSSSTPFRPLYGDKTLGIFQRIWVITLKHRQDRRAHMDALAEALDLSFTYHNGRDPFHNDQDRKMIEDIANFIFWERKQVEYDHPRDTESDFKIMYEFKWSEDAKRESTAILRPDDLQGSDLWVLQDSDVRKPIIPPSFPRYILASDGNGGLDQSKGRKPPHMVWQDSLMAEDLSTQDIMDAPKIACWLSHYEVLRKIAESKDEGPQLIFEDDIDFEWDLQHRLYQMYPRIPGWEVVFLGHCFSNGPDQPVVNGMPYLHVPTHVMCTHAYSITPTAARRLVRYLRSPLFAFSRPIDHVHNFGGYHTDFEKYVVEPPVVVQVPKSLLMSNIGTTDGSGIQHLVDGVFGRIQRAKEKGYEASGMQ